MLDMPTVKPSPKPLADLLAKENERKRRRRWKWWGLLAAAAAMAAGAFVLLQPKPPLMSARFRLQPAGQETLVREIRATGRVEAMTTVQVGAEISGRIADVLVDYNDAVKAGQVLAHFDRQALGAQSAQVAATLAAARAGVEQAKTDRERTARDLGRATRLHAQGNLSDANYDDAVSAARLAAQKVTAAEAQVAAQAAAQSLALTNLDHTSILSPIDGVVISRNIDPGQTVASVLQTPVLFTVAADLRKMRVIANVDEADIAEAAKGQKAAFTVNAFPDRFFDGIVTEVRNSPVVVQDVVTYGAVVEVDNPDLALKPGMTASVRLRVSTAQSAFSVPSAALRFTPPGESADAASHVWILDGGRLRKVPVKPGISDGESTEVAPVDLPAGAKIIVDLSPEGRKFYDRAR